MPKSLVTGGAGFVGSHLCQRLILEGHDVVCLDNLITSNLQNVQQLMGNSGFTFVDGDVSAPLPVKGPFDYVLHFASPASPRDYLQHPIETLKAGAMGTYNVLGLLQDRNTVFVLASTSEVYGDPEVNPQPETYWGHVNSVGPRSVYDEAKRFAEALSVAHHRVYGFDVRVVRIFNTYGPRMRLNDGRVLPNFMAQALCNEPITVYGDGSQTRSFCYVDDLVEGVYRTLTYPLRSKDGAQGAQADHQPAAKEEEIVINLGNPEEITILQLTKEVIEVTGSRSQIIFETLPVDDPKLRQPDITRARHLLGWEPKTPRREGLKRVVPYFREALMDEAYH